MNSIEKLTRIFSEFPGIGPRQARRFVYFLLTRQNGALEDLSKNILDLKKQVAVCDDCMRFYEKKHDKSKLCSICSDHTRDQNILMIVQRDVDLTSVEKNGNFNGIYFVLGGSVPILEKEPEKKIRLSEFKNFILKKNNEGLKEVILGMNWNPEGENTAQFIENFLNKTLEKEVTSNKVKISHLGKGLSMGTELEYIDPDTLRNALRNRN
jgi:recombination protein RecR